MSDKKQRASEKYKNLGGRPTKYRPEFCEKLIDHMAKGLSFETFGTVIGVDRATIYKWAKPENKHKYQGFYDAKRIAFEECRAWWEKVGNGLATGSKSVKHGNSAVWIYNMKCRFAKEWRDNPAEQQANVTINLSYNPDE